VSGGKREQRRAARKFRRLFVRYGREAPSHRAIAQQISTVGLFLATNESVYAEGSQVLIEIAGPAETWVVAGIVRHAFRVHPSMARFTRPGMGIELTSVPDGCKQYLASL
jgi:hypothetical protein